MPEFNPPILMRFPNSSNVFPKRHPIVACLHVVVLSSCTLSAAELSVQPPPGYQPLFNGKDLAGWQGLVGNPESRTKLSRSERAAAQAKADDQMRAHWTAQEGTLQFDGSEAGSNICTTKDYRNFVILLEYQIQPSGDSGVYLRGSPQVQIWDPALFDTGSGGLYNNQKHASKPLVNADNTVGTWNSMKIRMEGELVSVWLNDRLVVDSAVMENYWARKKRIYSSGPIELQSHGTPLKFRNIFVQELP
jgi:hypothetical protein